MPIDERLFDRISQKRDLLNSLKPFDMGALRRLKRSFDVEFTYNSNAIEGNTLSLSETRMVLEDGITVGGKTLNEHLEAANHGSAIEFVEGLVGKGKITEIDVLSLHALILDRIDPQNAGFYRRHRVRISGTDYIPPKPSSIPEKVQNLYEMLNITGGEPIQQAAMIHMEFVNIHPFIDGNGRCARLLMNLYLMRCGLVPVIVQKRDRKRYIDHIVASQTRGDHVPFINFVARCLDRSLTFYIDSLGDEEDDHIKLAEASRECRYSQEYLSLLARKGRIDAVKFGRIWMISRKVLEDYVREQDGRN
ncbi:MAG: Fic family protein [Candidatus Thermoplasmatota archaeon]|nr:Fic family protein [Candidatus Thermoplasmatota archaeon]